MSCVIGLFALGGTVMVSGPMETEGSVFALAAPLIQTLNDMKTSASCLLKTKHSCDSDRQKT